VAEYEFLRILGHQLSRDEEIRCHGGFDAIVQDGDELTIVPAIAGG